MGLQDVFTYHYMQPKEYRFSLDSIHLAAWVATELKSHPYLDKLRILDLCAGCGVIGFELLWHLRSVKQLDFVEVQDVYTDYFYQNVAIVNRPELQLRWHLLNYEALLGKEWESKFDLILSNPPYFRPEHGTLSPSEFKNRCRFFLDSSFAQFVLAIVNALAAGGKAYFLLRPSLQHGYDLFAELTNLLQGTHVTSKKISQVRGTDIVLLEKLTCELKTQSYPYSSSRGNHKCLPD